jgi:hypothetical protein
MDLWPQNGEKKTSLLKVRITPTEHLYLGDVATHLGLSISKYVRRVIFGKDQGLIEGEEHLAAHNAALRSRLARGGRKGQSDGDAKGVKNE